MSGRSRPQRGRSAPRRRTRSTGRRAVETKRVGGRRRSARPSARRKTNKRVRGWRSDRYSLASAVLVVVLGVAVLKLGYVQAFQAEALAERAERQRVTMIDIPAQRGAIVDRNGVDLAFSVETRTLQVNLRAMRAQWGDGYRDRVEEISTYIAAKVPAETSREELLNKFAKPEPFTFLVHNVEPSVAADIIERYPEIARETRSYREYPGGTLASNVVGFANWRMEDPDVTKHNLHGLIGLESARDNDLAGRPGRRMVDTAEGTNVIIPGTERDLRDAVAGSDLELTLDSDLQYYLQQQLAEYVEATDANGGSAVIMDARTAEVYAIANDVTFDPANLADASEAERDNRAVTTPYEPGSVNKVVTVAAAIEHGITEPDSVHQVPGSIRIADRTVRDAWSHGTVAFTTTGIIAKSSNVGTLMLAQELGEDAWLDTAERFGIGQHTGIGLPGETRGQIPPRSQWSGSTFGNLPIGQGLSMSVVQMASMYQAIANNGVRVEPRVVQATVRPDGARVAEPEPARIEVVSPETAATVLRMLEATVQRGGGVDNGTAPGAALDGYRVAGKTGTAQQINPATGTYSTSKYNITFAGVVPADDPRFVVAIMLDAPDTTLPEGSSAAPLFRDVASYLTQLYEIPLSTKESPVVPLVVG